MDIKKNRKTIESIDLTWEYQGPCPDQWYSYFYNKHENKTYCTYIRQDRSCWSASPRCADGHYVGEQFEKLPPEAKKWERIELAFDYRSDYSALDINEDRYFRKVVEEVILWLNYKFHYMHFNSQIRDNFDFAEEVAEGDKDSRMEVLGRRALLMQRYLSEYEKFLSHMHMQEHIE